MKARKPLPALIHAALTRDLVGVRKLLFAGSDPHALDSDSRTALHHAVINGTEDIVRLLLAHGARPNVPDREGWTPLHFAAQTQNASIGLALLEAGADVDARDAHGNTPLSRAVFEARGRGEMITLLLARGADKNLKNNHEVSPLDLASTIANYDNRKWLE